MPLRGPAFYRLVELEEPLTNLTSVPVAGTPFRFSWPKPVYVTGMFVFDKDGRDNAAALLRFSIQDQNGRQIATNGMQDETVPVLATVGKGRRWLPLNKRCFNLDTWTIQFFLSGPSELTVTPTLYLEFENDPSSPE